MTRTFVCADPHFGQGNILTFKREDGSPLRPFKSIEEHDNELVRRWNNVVGDGDRVYLLGDVVMARKNLHILGRLKGRLCLIKGNHDIFKLKEYTPYFDDIRAYVVHKHEDRKVILSHIPIHPDSVGRWGVNVHGHLHSNKIDDPRYICVSMEHIDYTPVVLQDLLKERLNG